MTCALCSHLIAPHPLSLGDAFTARSQMRSPWSDRMCDRCLSVASPGGSATRVWMQKADGDWSLIFSRSTSWLLTDPRDLNSSRNRPHFGPPEDHGKGSYPVLVGRPTNREIREFLLDPPEPPFCVAVATSGQKHILPFALDASDRDYFPVQFETETVWVDRAEFTRLLTRIEGLLGLGWAKAEVAAWTQQRSDRSAEAVLAWLSCDSEFGAIAPSPLFQLACQVAQRPEPTEPSNPSDRSEPAPSSVPEVTRPAQLSLF